MSTWVAALIAGAAITVTYFSCIRPMRRGNRCAMTPARKSSDRELAELREELDALRAGEHNKE